MAISKYFNVVNRSRAEVVGGFYAANSGQIQTGVLVLAAADRSLTLCGSSGKPDGFAEGLRQLVYAPTVLTLDAGEACSVISGNVLARVDASFFYTGVLPAEGDTIYSAANGLMAVTGTVKLGKCIKAGQDDDLQRLAAPNASPLTGTALIDVTIGGIQTV